MAVEYDPKQYWLEQGKTYKDKFPIDHRHYKIQEDIIVKYLSKLGFRSVLEVGCGFGRITKLMLQNFPDIETYDAFDLSPHQIIDAMEYTKFSHKVNYTISDIQSFQSDNKYDLVLISEVFLHMLPTEINNIISKLVNYSNKHIVNIDWYEENPQYKLIEPSNFIHNYEGIYNNIPSIKNVNKIKIEWRKDNLYVDVKQYLFHATTTT